MTAWSASIERVDRESSAIMADASWKPGYKLGGLAALLTTLLVPIQIAVFLTWPQPGSIEGWFALLHANRLVGLVDLDLLLMVDNVLLIVVYLALYRALRPGHQSLMDIATVLGLMAIAAHFASNPAFAMLSLSNRYAAAATEAQRAVFLAAGQAAMANFQGSAFNVYYTLGSIAPILICAVMLKTRLFGRGTAVTGIVANVIAFGLYVPAIGPFFAILSVVGLEVWYLLLARTLLRLDRAE